MECIEIPWIDPARAFLALADDPHLVFFDSAAAADIRSRSSYLCCAPIACLMLQPQTPDPFKNLREWRTENRPADHRRPAIWPFPFAGGAAGWIGYDLGRAASGVESRFVPVPDLPGGWFGLFDTVVGFDHASERAWIQPLPGQS